MSRVPDKLPLPIATIRAFKSGGSSCKNVGLLFDRYLRFTGSQQSAWDMDKYNGNDTAKEWNLKQITQVKSDFKGFKAVIERWIETAQSQHAKPFRLTPEWRFAVGLGNESAIENGFTFHRIYGFPIIPGSALKGVARMAALSEIADALGVPRLGLAEVKKRTEAEKQHRCHQKPCGTPLGKLEAYLLANQKEEEKAWDKLQTDPAVVKQLRCTSANEAEIDQIRRVFGSQYAAGKAIFFDAMPVEAPTLEIDVMNVHYPDYYGRGEEFPTDSQNPKLIPFLTVGQTPFWFAVGWRGKADGKLQHQAVTWLKIGLTEFGVGAKTAAGYGYFEEK